MDRPGPFDIVLRHADLEAWAGRKLTTADISAIRGAIPHSTIPDVIRDIAFSIHVAFLDHHDEEE